MEYDVNVITCLLLFFSIISTYKGNYGLLLICFVVVEKQTTKYLHRPGRIVLLWSVCSRQGPTTWNLATIEQGHRWEVVPEYRQDRTDHQRQSWWRGYQTPVFSVTNTTMRPLSSLRPNRAVWPWIRARIVHSISSRLQAWQSAAWPKRSHPPRCHWRTYQRTRCTQWPDYKRQEQKRRLVSKIITEK